MVYVDNFFETPMGKFGRMKMSHMIADSTEELLEMAHKTGVAAKWIQYPNTPREHFDICMSKRLKAIQLGAKEISCVSLGRIILERAENGNSTKQTART